MKKSVKLFSITGIVPWMKERSNGASAVKYIVIHLGDHTAESNTNHNEKEKEDQN